MPGTKSADRLTPQALHAVLFVIALSVSLFFNGYRVEYLAVSLCLLLAWFVHITWTSYETGLRVPRTAFALLLTAFWLWLGVSVLWSKIPSISTINFFYIGSLPLAFWLYALERNRSKYWSVFSPLVAALAVLLSFVAAYQLLVLQITPRSVFLDVNSHAAFLALIALPCASVYLSVVQSPGRRRLAASIAAALFVLSFAIAITGGRGVMSAYGVGCVMFILITWPRVRAAAIAGLALIVTTACIVGNLLASGNTVERLATLADPVHAGAPRFIIWEAAWRMLQAHPLLGTGFGTFYLFYPAYRHPDDTSSGYMVHNDYLQLWIEGGLPALLIIMLIGVVLCVLLLRVWRSRTLDPPAVLEAAGLGCGVLVVALHSNLNFNFYTMPTLLLCGIMLARFSLLVEPRPLEWVVVPQRILRPSVYRVSITLLALIPVIYLGSLAVSEIEYQRGLQLAQAGKLIESDKALNRAERFSPQLNNVLVTHADLMRHFVSLLPAVDRTQRESLYREASQMLDRAEEINRYHALTYFVRGQLYRESPDITGASWYERSVDAYQMALTLDPRFYRARQAYAEIARARGRTAQAREILEQGLGYWYPDTPDLIPYLALTARLRHDAGDYAGASDIAARATRIGTRSGYLRRPAPHEATLVPMPKS